MIIEATVLMSHGYEPKRIKTKCTMNVNHITHYYEEYDSLGQPTDRTQIVLSDGSKFLLEIKYEEFDKKVKNHISE